MNHDQPVIPANLTEEEAGDLYQFFHSKFGWAGGHFDSSDIESAWVYQQEYDDPTLRDITDEDVHLMMNTRDWGRYVSDSACTAGNEVIEQLVSQYVNNLGEEQ